MVHMIPLPLAFRSIPRLYWPSHPPIRVGPEQPADRAEALALYLALDADSQHWYRGLRPWLGLPPAGVPRKSKRTKALTARDLPFR
jgi:hypothetical protein